MIEILEEIFTKEFVLVLIFLFFFLRRLYRIIVYGDFGDDSEYGDGDGDYGDGDFD